MNLNPMNNVLVWMMNQGAQRLKELAFFGLKALKTFFFWYVMVSIVGFIAVAMLVAGVLTF